MSSAIDPTLRGLNDCGCCEGISVQTPVKVDNRPGLTAIAYRVGTHAQFKQTLLARLSGSRLPALRRLTTRDEDDFSIALLDAWATVAEVLTFYQERIANEAYLRTATERRSVLELARLIDYALRPGVAASTYLAFTIEDAPGAFGQALSLGTTAQSPPAPPPPIAIDIGTRVQSIPGPGEQAQTFETIEKIEARAEWNAIQPRLRQPQGLSIEMESILLQGTATNLKPGDTLLMVESADRYVTRRVMRVTPDEDAKTTWIDFGTPLESIRKIRGPRVAVGSRETLPGFSDRLSRSPSKEARPMAPAQGRLQPIKTVGQAQPPGGIFGSTLPQGNVTDFPTRIELDDNAVQAVLAKTWHEGDLSALAQIQNWSVESLVANIANQTARREREQDAGVFAFRQRVAIFGHNAPRYSSLRDARGDFLYPHDWDTRGWEIWKDSITNAYYTDADLYLERSLSDLIQDSWAVLELSTTTGSSQTVYRIRTVNEASVAGFGISGKSTGLRLAQGNGSGLADNTTDKPQAFLVRKTTVHLQSEPLALADLPIEALVQGSSLTLDRTYLGLQVGQKIILTGERSDLQGVVASEVMTLKEVIIEVGFTVLTFDQSLVYRYVRKMVTLNANVALATHGETVQEVLGSGDAGQPFQRFPLRQPPLTYISASTPSGAQTTLEVRANDLRWHEVPHLFGHGPEDRIYVTHTDDDGRTTVAFGDGKTGARLPTGQENVKAKYRKGIGLPGLVQANQLTLLMTRPLGVKGVTNPLAPNGAADRETLDEARRNAPLTVLTLGRIVSLQDYEDFARAFAGIEKALATWTWVGERRSVLVTVAGSKGAEVKRGSPLYQNLLAAMRQAGDPTVPLRVESYQPRLFRLSAAVQLDPDDLPEKVLAAVEQKLREGFSFEARTFGQPVHLSEVIAVIQGVPGVKAVDVNTLYRTDQPAGLTPHLEAAIPQPGGDQVFAAEMLTLDPRPLALEVLP